MPDVDGALQLKALGAKLKALGAGGALGAADLGPGFGAGKTLRAQLLAGIRAGAAPAVEATRQAARETLPKKGGLNEYIATEKIKIATRLSGPTVGVRITAKGGWGSNQGVVRHPVFGRRDKPWAEQPIPTSGWFVETLNREAPKVIPVVRAAMEAVAVEVTRRV